MHLRELFREIISLPKTLFFNFSVLPFRDAIKLPFYVDCDVKLGKLCKNVIQFEYIPSRFDIRIGKKVYDDAPIYTKGIVSFSPLSSVVFSGKTEFSYGITLITIGNAKMRFGENFYCNKNCAIVCRDSIWIGNDVLIGWNVNIRDSDGATHEISTKGVVSQNHKPIIISNHVWICAFSHILKGVVLQPETVVAYNSCVVCSFQESNIIIGGSPAKIVKTGIEWKR